jgi:hypothetical protein
MRTIDLADPDCPVRFAGILDPAPTAEGISLRRLPAWTRSQIVEPALDLLSSMPAGGRIEFASDTTTVELDVKLVLLAVGDRPLGAGVFELAVDGAIVASDASTTGTEIRVRSAAATDVDVRHGPPTTIRFGPLEPGSKRIEIWLPHNTTVEVRALRVDTDSTVSASPRTGRQWVHYGSSISHCLEAPTPTGAWPVIVARSAGVDLVSLAIAGQCQLDQLVARTIRDLDTDLISVKVGINIVNADSMRERVFVPALHGFLDTIRDGHQTTPILLVSPIICPVAEDHPGPTIADETTGRIRIVDRPTELATGALSLHRIRDLIDVVVATRRSSGDEALHFLDGRELFGIDDLDHLPDGLHPDPIGYERIAERFDRFAFGPDGPFATRPGGASST